MMGFPIKAEWLYDAVNTIRDWIKGTSNDKPKVEVSGEVEVDGSVTVKNFPETQKVSADEPLPVSINNSNTTLPVSINEKDVVIGLLADRPPASEMRGRGYYAWDETDGHKLKYSDGTNWVVNK